MAASKFKKQSALSALTLSALTIPSISNAAVVPEDKVLSVRYTQYQEAEIPIERVSSGSTERYGIDILQVRYFTPYKGKYSIDTSVQYETMSGASPYGSSDNGSGQTEVLMSGASGGIEEKRLDASVLATRYYQEGTLAGSVFVSKENDYQSIGVGVSGSVEINNKHTTLLGSFSTSFDKLSPTDADSFATRLEADGETKRSVSIYEGVTQVIDKYRTLQIGVGYTRLKGYLSDPYKFTDKRPDTREQTTLTAQYRQFLTHYSGMAWHLDYRFYQDDWEVQANTISTSVWKNMAVGAYKVTLAPNLRYHWQHAADFYNLASNPSAEGYEFYSSDFRLSAYGAFAMGIDMQFHYKDIIFNLGFSQYVSSEDWGLTGSQDTETPSLVNFTTFSLGVDYLF